MKINLSPQRRDEKLTVEKTGDKLRINGELFNFGPLPDGAKIESGIVPCPCIVGPVSRINGQIELTLILPHGANPSQAVAFPETIIDPKDGTIELPFDPIPEPPVMPKELTNVDG